MAAYTVVISLKHTINGLINSSSCSSSREILEFAYDEATSLQQVLERLNGRGRSRSSMERLDAVEGQMRDCANKLEDFLEFRELNIQKKQDEEEIEELIKEVTSFAETTKKTAEEYIEELSRDDGNDDDEEEEEEEGISDFGMEMVGRSSELTVFRERLLKKMRPVVDLCFYSFFGEKGSGRTIVAKTVYQELRKRRGEYFDCWAWVTVGSKTHQQVLMSIISQVQAPDDDHNHDHDHDHCNTNNIRVAAADDYELLSHLCKTLENRRYMIALDDVDDAELVNHLKTSLLDESNGSLVLFTTTSEEVALLGDYFNDCRFNPRVFNETVWFCIRAAFFGSELNVPPEIEEVGKKIVENCRGRLIAAVKVMLYLIKAGTATEEWSKIAADEQSPVFMVEDEISEITKIKEMQSSDTSDESNREFDISSMFDFSNSVADMKRSMQPKRFFSKMQIISMLGMAGIGKTMFIRKIFEDRTILSHFDHHVWITLSPRYQMKEILIDILAQIYLNIEKMHMREDDRLIKDLCVQVSHKRVLKSDAQFLLRLHPFLCSQQASKG